MTVDKAGQEFIKRMDAGQTSRIEEQRLLKANAGFILQLDRYFNGISTNGNIREITQTVKSFFTNDAWRCDEEQQRKLYDPEEPQRVQDAPGGVIPPYSHKGKSNVAGGSLSDPNGMVRLFWK